MTPRTRNLALTAHITASVGWIGALAVFLAHALASTMSQDPHVVRSMSIAMGITAWFVILPLSLATLATGLVQALGTAWGLFKHYWIIFKLLLTGITTAVLLMKLQPISFLAEAATEATFSASDHTGLQKSLVFHSVGGLVILLAILALAVFKPKGMTSTGIRAMPRWAKIVGSLVIILISLVAIMAIFGAHGPGAHSH
jgi:flagellar biosynthesis protein FlhB